MRGILSLLKTTLLGGALVVLPAWLATLLFIKAVSQLAIVVKPVSAHLPESVIHPDVVATLLMLLVCFAVGLLVRTRFGKDLRTIIENRVFEKIPGYTLFRGVALQMGDLEKNQGFKPALVEIEDALAPCFIVEEHAGDLLTVFIPSAPTPAAGTILIVAGSRVHPVAVPVTSLFKCVTKWGTGSAELLAMMEPEPEAAR
ncbi:DUF502 domain-containing protein [Luteolibacter yonseiensis]|uniref:DUF502 domain-containing protein n=1 Tax=Luteolibacter yonseiensis TaxID=1144680 RepID=A0A934R367_9BACT|nr:DUF502 domain-containing protein [Luteolibacter yonseiensis]MBK1816191.1 DUF502 domain-containing protein [Luteolibacter yonseiensis]